MLTISILDSDESEIEMFLVKSSKKINTQKTISNKKSLMPSTSHEFSMCIYLLYLNFGLQ